MISKHISYKEGVYSNTALRRGIDNTPNDEQLNNMELIAEKVFEPLRCPELIKAIGGSSKSQHCKGQAIDIDDTFGRASNAEMFVWIKHHLDFDQMIWEFGDDDNPAWVHISYVSTKENRNRCLKAYKENGKTKYKVI